MEDLSGWAASRPATAQFRSSRLPCSLYTSRRKVREQLVKCMYPPRSPHSPSTPFDAEWNEMSLCAVRGGPGGRRLAGKNKLKTTPKTALATR